MSQQVTNFPEAIKTLLYDNWTLKDELVKTKISWASYKVKPNLLTNNPITITVEEVSGVGAAQSPKFTKIDTLFKIDLYMKFKPEEKDEIRIQNENTRALMKDMIMKIIHDNQTGIIGIKIATFGRFLNADEVEQGPTILHSTIFIVGQWWHSKS